MYCETYRTAIPQFLEDEAAAFSKSDKPTRDTVGTIARGLTKRRIRPIIPVIR